MSLYVNATYIVNHTYETPIKKKNTMPFATGQVSRGDLVFTYLYDNTPNTESKRKPYRGVDSNKLSSKVFVSMPHCDDLAGQIRVAGIANSASTIALGRDLETSLQITGQCQLRIPSMRTKVQVGDALYINAFLPPIRDYTKGEDGVPHYVPVVYTVPSMSDSLEKMLSDAVGMYTDWYKKNNGPVPANKKSAFFESCVKPNLLWPVKYDAIQTTSITQENPYYKYFKSLTLCIAWVLSETDGISDHKLINLLLAQSVDNHRDYYIGTCIETSTFPFCAVIRR
jgi:hypothetical protein